MTLVTAESMTKKVIQNTRHTFCAGGCVEPGTRLQ